MLPVPSFSCFFFFNDTATTEIYTLSLHDALPIYRHAALSALRVRDLCSATHSGVHGRATPGGVLLSGASDRKSTRLNSSHQIISYAVFCLKKKKTMDEIDKSSFASVGGMMCTDCR